MKTGLSQSTSLRQELKINPRLYQAMDLLYMPLLDLQQHLKQELLINPFLELIEPEDDDQEADQESEAEGENAATDLAEAPAPETEPAKENEVDWEEILLDGFDTPGHREEHEEKEYYEPVSVERRGLDDHLRDQVALLDLNPRQLLLAEEFIGNIDENGWLACSLEELLNGINDVVIRAAEEVGRDAVPLYTMEEAEAMLKTIQLLDPPGVGARNLRECLLIQIRDGGREATLEGRLVNEAFDELINHRWSEISKRFGVSVAEVQAAADEVAKLDPKPGLRHSESSDNYIVADLVIDKIDGKYHVFINDNNLPRLRLSKVYQEIARDRRKFDGENKEFISSKMNSANWMIQAIEQRRQTMLKVTNYIVDRQRDFFEKGIQYLKPLTLREVAEHIGMHESTVSRVTNEKFVQTPRGVLPLKFFFSSGLSTTGGEDVSARGIKDQIQKLVEGEDPKSPLTDQAIVSILSDQGVNIARRTVAKYRDQLGVLSARMRKRV
ncbi:MAG TPA: RNA polymerase factor sigma-54 [Gemmatimonadaceae bacterium]|nr:RNA polymerase factor sigma-54 [Gemmatimonadaceae bacterium]